MATGAALVATRRAVASYQRRGHTVGVRRRQWLLGCSSCAGGRRCLGAARVDATAIQLAWLHYLMLGLRCLGAWLGALYLHLEALVNGG